MEGEKNHIQQTGRHTGGAVFLQSMENPADSREKSKSGKNPHGQSRLQPQPTRTHGELAEAKQNPVRQWWAGWSARPQAHHTMLVQHRPKLPPRSSLGMAQGADAGTGAGLRHGFSILGLDVVSSTGQSHLATALWLLSH